MRVAVVHYHYRPGGVTRVVENAFGSIQGRDIAAVAICGEPYSGGKMPVRLQPGLRYSQPNEKISPGPLWYALKMTARQALGGEPDLWHFHNPALGKNSAMAEVVGKMAAEAPVLLQFHDFAEDGRPANYAMLRDRMENIGRLYPQGAQVHYATGNARDHAFLCASGFNPANVHLLPNPVCVPGLADDLVGGGTGLTGGFGRTGDGLAAASSYGSAAVEGLPAACAEDVAAATASVRGPLAGLDALGIGQGLYLYPTRGIRRKNMGEFLLWAALSASGGSGGRSAVGEENALFATTLEPENPAARAVYERWVAFAGGLGLPVAFGVGQGKRAPSFAALMQRAQAVISTSVAEGFGLAFLEPWLFGKNVVGRNLPDITTDFATQGVNLSGLYERLLIPETLIDMQALRQKIADGMERTYAAYRRPMPQDAVAICLRASGDGQGNIDFACLDEDLQERVITALATSLELARELVPHTLCSQGNAATGAPARIDSNARAVAEHYGLARYGERLAALYRQVADSHRTGLQYADPERVLDQFLAPERFRLLCS